MSFFADTAVEDVHSDTERGIKSVPVDSGAMKAIAQATGTSALQRAKLPTFTVSELLLPKFDNVIASFYDRAMTGITTLARNLVSDISIQAIQALLDSDAIAVAKVVFEKSREAEELLGIDWDKPETVEPYAKMYPSQVYAEAEKARNAIRILENVHPATAERLLAKNLERLDTRQKRKMVGWLEQELSNKQKPGPIPMTAEEKIALAIDFYKSGLSQIAYCGIRGISRYSLQQAVKWYRSNA